MRLIGWGPHMQTQGSRLQKSLLLIGCLAVFSACNQQEFYEKQFLEGAGVADDRGPAPGVVLPTDPDDGVVITNPDDGGDSDDNGSNNPDDGDGDNGGGVVVVPNPDDGDDDTGGGNNGGGDDDNDDGEVVVVNPTPTPTPDGNGDDDDGDDGDDNDGEVVIVDPTPNPDDNGGGGDDGDDGDDNDGEVVVVDPTPTPEPEPEVILSDRVEKFIQNKAKDAPVDILWVVDDSGSMGDEQRSLAYNFEVFINEFIEKKIDFKMAITTTDGSSRGDGKWKINPDHLTSEAAAKNEAKFLKDFKRTIQVGTNGSGTEVGLQTAKRFLERYEGHQQHQWLRDDAYLIIVVLSDEEEQAKASVESMVSAYQSYKKNAGLVKVYTIVTTDLRGQQWETVGHRYMQAANMTNGVIADIHQDFYTVLRDMGTKIVDLLDQFALAQAPYQGVVVKVNGTQVNDGFVYNNETKTIKFLEGHIPAEGSEIEVRYQVVQPNTTILASGSN